MLHLSLVHLPRGHSDWHHVDMYQAHQLVWRAFPGTPERERPFLFSHEERARHQSILVQSTQTPDWAFLNGAADIAEKTFDPNLIPTGVPLKFFLRANPTVDRKGFPDGKTRRVGVGTNSDLAFRQMGRLDEAPDSPTERAIWREQQLRDWLQRQGDNGGFVIKECTPGPIVERRAAKSDRRRVRGKLMTFHEVEFTGTLEIVDGPAFSRTCESGVGRGKAFGFGLLMIRR